MRTNRARIIEAGQSYGPGTEFETTRGRAKSLAVEIIKVLAYAEPDATAPVRVLRGTRNRLATPEFDRMKA